MDIGVQAHSALALAAQLLLTEVHQPPGQPPAGQAGTDDQGVDDPYLLRGGGDGPGDLAVFRELDPIEVDTAADRALLLQDPEGALLQRLTGGVPGGIPAALPVGIGDRAGVLQVQDLVIDPGDGVQIGVTGGSDHHGSLLSSDGGFSNVLSSWSKPHRGQPEQQKDQQIQRGQGAVGVHRGEIVGQQDPHAGAETGQHRAELVDQRKRLAATTDSP